MRLFTFSLLLLVVSAGSAYAQSSADSVTGKLITTSADTLYGSILLGDQYDHSWQVRFRESGANDYQTYGPDEVHMYDKDGSFRYFSVEGDFEDYGLRTVFIREDIGGELTLYSTMVSREEAAFFVGTRDGRLIYLQSGFYIDQLRSIFSGCNEFLRGGERVSRRYRLTHEGMYSVFTSYYECADSEAQWNVEPRGVHRTTKFGVIAGASYSKANQSSPISIFRNVDYGYTLDYLAGVFLDIRLRNTGLFVRPELNYMYISSEVTDFDASRNVEKFARAEVHMISIEAPFRKEFEYSNTLPYFGGGASVGYIIDENVTLTETFSGGTVANQNEVRLHTYFTPGFNLKAGMRFEELFGDSDLFTEIRYRYAFTDDRSSSALNGIRAFNLMVGITF
ncbi:MAG: PorT family protein [Balneolia bacterium]|nr:PorT family protein [Balneolia bacterium]